MIPTSVLSAIEEFEPIVEPPPLSLTEEAEPTIEAPSPPDVKAIIPSEGGDLAGGHAEVPSLSWALEPIDDMAEIDVTMVASGSVLRVGF